MAKVSAPLLSFGASGTIAKTQTYSTWRGVPYARQHVIPSNPRSPDQTSTRTAFTWLTQIWKLANPIAQEPWNAYAAGRPFTGRNSFLSKNISGLRTATDISDMIFSPGARGGLAVADATGTGSAGGVSIAITAPELPVGWTIVSAVAWLVKQTDPQTDTVYTSEAVADNATPFVCAFTGLTAGTYVWGVWFKFMKPNGQLAYSPSFNGTTVAT